MNIIESFHNLLFGCYHRLSLYCYRRSLPKRVELVRKKERIKVLFVLSDISLWKTEELYKAMLKHSRFEPVLGVALLTNDIASESIKKYHILIDYLLKSNYSYVEICDSNINSIRPDIIFYQQPYDGFISETISFLRQIRNGALICDVHYSMRTLAIKPSNKWIIDLDLFRYCWQMYVENDITAGFGKLSILKGKNIIVTGMPIQDVLAQSKSSFDNPWKGQSFPKKRIIFAPHHSIPHKGNLMNLSKFLDVADVMIEFAKKYEEQVQFAFKPHPFLRKALTNVWTNDKINTYYSFWEKTSNTQLCEGNYLGLFKYSDAMIHDCDSFTLEYCYMKKPVLFIVDKAGIKQRENDLNDFGKMAFDLHDKGYEKDIIDDFIKSVINDEDSKIEQRCYFYDNFLLPPNHLNATDNIINAILFE